MEQLVEKLKVILATSYSLALKAQNYHWNVVGENFGEYHDFFGTYYEEVGKFVDLYAEHIRQLDSFAPGSLSRFSELTKISDETGIPSARFMFVRLDSDNSLFLELLKELRRMAEDASDFGLVNTTEDAIRFHSKMKWMIKARLD
jgi:starvation-inducible DNA-binding protein